MDGLKMFLTSLGMLKYYNMFVAKGYDLESDLPHITAGELEDVLMVACKQDRAILLAKAQSYKPRPEHVLFQWLKGCSLDYYFISFVNCELTDLQRIAQLQLPDEELYDELEIVLPGHRKRLERAVNKLRSEQISSSGAEIPVTYGWWGKPECLPQAKFDFLCVKAFLFSLQNPKNCAAVDFMVDSGSDVSTVQESILEGLNLELIGPVYSCGVHGGNHCNLYRARIAVGKVEMEIEVMGSNYNSLGSRVVRHFRHVIDGHRHIWLPGNYHDPLPAILPLQMPQSSSSQLKALPASSDKDQLNVLETSSADNSTILSTSVPPNQGIMTGTIPVSSESQKCGNNIFVSTIVKKPQEVKSSTSQSNTKNSVNTSGLTKNEENKSPNFSQQKSVFSHSHCQQQLEDSDSTSSISTSHNHIVLDSEKDSQALQNTGGPNSAPVFSNTGLETCEKGIKGVASVAMNDALKIRDVAANRRLSLSNVIPANLKDTDDDVDYHQSPQEQNHCFNQGNSASTSGNKIYQPSALNNPDNSSNRITTQRHLRSTDVAEVSFSSENEQNSLHQSGLTLHNSSCSYEKSNPISFANNFVQASNEVVLLSLDDLDAPEPATPYDSNSQDHLLSEARPDVIAENKFHSPRKKFKSDSS